MQKDLDITFIIDEHRKIHSASVNYNGEDHMTFDVRTPFVHYKRLIDFSIVLSKITLVEKKVNDDINTLLETIYRKVECTINCEIDTNVHGRYTFIYPDQEQLHNLYKTHKLEL